MLRVRVAQGEEKSTIALYMAEGTKNCLHLEGLRAATGSNYRCPVCGESLDGGGVAGWVREAEEARDEAYSLDEGDGFAGIARQEAQREVYRRRRIMYELENVPRVATTRPEMILVVHDIEAGSYQCRIFYKEPRQAGSVEQVSVAAALETILELRSDPDPVVRLIAEKVEEFHAVREKLVGEGEPAPGRRVFYANELRAVG
ncbi:MAG: hypothetical protein M3534_03770 [Actinomycetota bacterium]|nr:hypothetical protein [Actinomycetota bacterium]